MNVTQRERSITVCRCKGIIEQDLACPRSILSLCFHTIVAWSVAVQCIAMQVGRQSGWLAG